MNLEQLPWKDIITIAIASVGAVLGIMNTWNSINQRLVRLKITPAFVTDSAGSPLGFSVEAVNLSNFPIVVAEIGFKINRRQKAPLQSFQLRDGASLPKKLDARDALTAYFGPQDFILPKGANLREAYIRTACGRIFYGDSPARKQLSEIISDIAEKHG